jgi:scyllo-inositol 2-dehydrogenase (NADP+)
LAIVPSQVAHVSGLNQKRVWDHVTNADHAQVTINFADGVLATFVNSDLAAARKPKFFVLGTKGAIVGNWDTSAGDSVADLPAIITLNRADGSSQVIPFVTVEPFLFHASLAKFLADGTPMTVEAKQSRDVVAIMQAAEESALKNGLPVTPSLLRS